MKAFISLTFCLLFCNLNLTYSQLHSNDLQITNIANEGFLVQSSTKKILIDALFSDGYGVVSVPPKEVTTDIMNAKAPFDNINMLLLTHYHKDHCDPVLINEYLTKYKNIPFVTNKPSIVFIDGNCFGFIAKKKQFVVMTPEANQSISQTINNIPVKVFGLKHLSFYRDSVDLEETMLNYSFLIELDGIKIFHSGDIQKNAFQDYLARNKRWTDSIDVAFLYFGLLESGESDLDYVLNTLHPKYIIVTHVIPKEMEKWSVKTEQLKKKFPNIILFRNSMDSKTINIKDTEK